MELLAVFTTVSTEEQAELLASTAIERELAACVQAETIRSTYRWKGEVTKETEVRLMFKTTQARYAALEQLLLEMHPYEVPSVFAVAVVNASPAYANWVQEAVVSPASGP
jgi:periplasmic divalent cation tolerance protein